MMVDYDDTRTLMVEAQLVDVSVPLMVAPGQGKLIIIGNVCIGVYTGKGGEPFKRHELTNEATIPTKTPLLVGAPAPPFAIHKKRGRPPKSDTLPRTAAIIKRLLEHPQGLLPYELYDLCPRGSLYGQLERMRKANMITTTMETSHGHLSQRIMLVNGAENLPPLPQRKAKQPAKEITNRQERVLAALSQHPNGMTFKQLGEFTGIGRNNVGYIVDGLVEANKVNKTLVENDRGANFYEITLAPVS